MKNVKRSFFIGLALAATVFSAPMVGASESTAAPLSTISGDGFKVKITKTEARVGVADSFLVIVEAKAGYKVNDKFPHKVKMNAPPSGLKLPKRTLKKKDARFEGTKRLTFTVPVEATRKGAFKLDGKLKLSVCNEETCLIKKPKFVAKIKAK